MNVSSGVWILFVDTVFRVLIFLITQSIRDQEERSSDGTIRKAMTLIDEINSCKRFIESFE